jgi:hypothetical protein
MVKSTTEGAADAAPSISATTGRDESSPIVPAIPSAVLADAGKKQVARLDFVLRMDGVDVSAEGAGTCRENGRSIIGREPGGGAPGSFDESALQKCLSVLIVKFAADDRIPVATLTRAGVAVPTTYFDALTTAIKRAGVRDVIVQP